MKLADLEVGTVYYAEPRNSDWVNQGAYDVDNKMGRYKVELLDKTRYRRNISWGYYSRGESPYTPDSKGAYVKVRRFAASTDARNAPLGAREDREDFVTIASLRGIWDDLVAERREDEARWHQEAEEALEKDRQELARRAAITTRAAARGLKGLRADDSGTYTIREEDLVKFLDATESTDWATTAQDLMSGDPRLIAKHLPKVPDASESGPTFSEQEYAELRERYRKTGGRTPNPDERAADQEALAAEVPQYLHPRKSRGEPGDGWVC